MRVQTPYYSDRSANDRVDTFEAQAAFKAYGTDWPVSADALVRDYGRIGARRLLDHTPGLWTRPAVSAAYGRPTTGYRVGDRVQSQWDEDDSGVITRVGTQSGYYLDDHTGEERPFTPHGFVTLVNDDRCTMCGEPSDYCQGNHPDAPDTSDYLDGLV